MAGTEPGNACSTIARLSASRLASDSESKATTRTVTAACLPAESRCDGPGFARIERQAALQPSHVGNFRLGLVNHERPVFPAEREEVDPAARVRIADLDLRRGSPPEATEAPRREPVDDRVHAVALTTSIIEVSPLDPDGRPQAEGLDDALDKREIDASRLVRLEPPDSCL